MGGNPSRARRRPRIVRAALLAVTACLLDGCGDDGDPSVSAAPRDGEARYEGTITVLENTAHGPQMCGSTLDSYPPQCAGIEVSNWSWDEVEDEESAGGTTWGTFHLVGTYLDGAFSLTETPRAPDPRRDPRADDDRDFSTPCPEPEGGWRVVDPSRATAQDRGAAQHYALAQGDYAGSWGDSSINPAASRPINGLDDELAAGDPTKSIFNARFTGDVERHEAELRALWGGPLCVTAGGPSLAELRTIGDSLRLGANHAGTSLDVVDGVVEVIVIVDDGVQERLDAEHGKGRTRVIASLEAGD